MKSVLRKFLGTILLSLISAVAWSQSVVSDPTSVAQRALIFAEQMSEAIEEKYAMLEQVAQAQQHYEFMKKGLERTQNAAAWIKTSKVYISILQEVENLHDSVERFRKDLSKSKNLTIDEQYKYYTMGFGLCSLAMDVLTTARQYVSDFKSDNDGGLSSADRLQLLENIRDDIAGISAKLDLIRFHAQYHIDRKVNGYEQYTTLFNTFSTKAK